MDNLDLKDKRILFELEKNARQGSSQIGKKIGLPWDVVNYRIKRLEERGIIKNYITIVDLSKLGYQQFKIYLQLQHITKEKFDEMINYLKELDEVKWIAKCDGRWDLIVAVVTQSIQIFEKIKNEFFSRYSQFIATRSITTMISAYTSRRTYLLKERKIIELLCVMSQPEKIKIDEIDSKIIKTLFDNARIPIIELAKKINISTRIAGYKIKQLENKKIILGYRITLDLEKIGYKFFKSFIYLENATEEKIKLLLGFCNQHPNIIHNVVTMGNWELEPEFEVETNEEFYNIINELRNKFSDIIKIIETIIISKEYKFSYI